MHYLSNFHDLLSNIYRDVTWFALYLCLSDRQLLYWSVWWASSVSATSRPWQRTSASPLNLGFFLRRSLNYFCTVFMWDYAHVIVIFFVPCLQRLDTLMIIWSLKLCVWFIEIYFWLVIHCFTKGLITFGVSGIQIFQVQWLGSDQELCTEPIPFLNRGTWILASHWTAKINRTSYWRQTSFNRQM